MTLTELNPGEPRLPSFEELGKVEDLGMGSFLDAYHEYAARGLSLSGSEVIALAQRFELTAPDLDELVSVSLMGIETLAENADNRFPHSVLALQTGYQLVLNFAAPKSAQERVAAQAAADGNGSQEAGAEMSADGGLAFLDRA